MYKDQVIECSNCGQEFVWTQGEQEFFAKNKLEAPTHCMICRSVMQSAKSDSFRGKIKNKRDDS